MRSDPTGTPSSTGAARSAWGARALALILGIGVLLLGLLAIDEAGRRAPGESLLAVTTPLSAAGPGAPVLVGNSVAKSAINIDDVRDEVNQPTMVDLTLHGTGPTSWYVLFTHHLTAGRTPPRVLVLVSSMGWMGRSVPVADRDFALEIATSDDPQLASLLGITPDALGWERRFAERLRVRDALVQLLGRPLALAVAGPDSPLGNRDQGPIDHAVQLTVGQNAGANMSRDASRPTGVNGPKSFGEVEPALISFFNATAEAGTRVILVLLPQRETGPFSVSVGMVAEISPKNVQIVDMTQIPFSSSDYRDNQHFSPDLHDALSRSIAYHVSLAWLRKSARLIEVAEHP